MLTRRIGLYVCAGLTAIVIGGCGKESASKKTISERMDDVAKSGNYATVSYRLEPSRELPAGLTKVAILPVKASFDDKASSQWAQITANTLTRLIDENKKRTQAGRGLMFVNRADGAMRRSQDEKDMALAGVTDEAAIADVKQLGVQAFIDAQVIIKVDEKRSQRSSGGGISIRGVSLGGGGSGENIARDTTVQVVVSLTDAATNEKMFPLDRMLNTTDRVKAGFFGGDGVADLKDTDAAIRDTIGVALTEFVANLFGAEISFELPVYSSGLKESTDGVGALRAGLFSEAVTSFQAALAKDPVSIDHYNLGVAYEGLGRLDDAMRSYQNAIRISGDEVYKDALARAKRYKDRLGN